MAGLNKEIWIADIREGFLPNTSFISQSQDMSMWVENDKINLADAGVNPDVLVNNSTFPVPINDRVDNPLSLELNMYDTVNTRLRKAEMIELAYDKRASVVRGHQNALRLKIAAHAAWSWTAGTTDATNNNKVFDLTGASAFTFNHIIDLQNHYDSFDAPEGERILVLNPNHVSELQKDDLKLFKSIFSSSSPELYGFKLFKYSKTPRFDASLNKKAFGAANAGTDKVSSFAFLSSEVMTAMGTTDMFERLNDPEARADILGFQQRALALPIRNKGLATIVR